MTVSEFRRLMRVGIAEITIVENDDQTGYLVWYEFPADGSVGYLRTARGKNRVFRDVGTAVKLVRGCGVPTFFIKFSNVCGI